MWIYHQMPYETWQMNSVCTVVCFSDYIVFKIYCFNVFFLHDLCDGCIVFNDIWDNFQNIASS